MAQKYLYPKGIISLQLMYYVHKVCIEKSMQAVHKTAESKTMNPFSAHSFSYLYYHELFYHV